MTEKRQGRQKYRRRNRIGAKEGGGEKWGFDGIVDSQSSSVALILWVPKATQQTG